MKQRLEKYKQYLHVGVQQTLPEANDGLSDWRGSPIGVSKQFENVLPKIRNIPKMFRCYSKVFWHVLLFPSPKDEPQKLYRKLKSRTMIRLSHISSINKPDEIAKLTDEAERPVSKTNVSNNSYLQLNPLLFVMRFRSYWQESYTHTQYYL